jgi:hypothetical protein
MARSSAATKESAGAAADYQEVSRADTVGRKDVLWNILSTVSKSDKTLPNFLA